MTRINKLHLIAFSILILALDQAIKFIILKKVLLQDFFLVNVGDLEIKLELIKNVSLSFGLPAPRIVITLIMIAVIGALVYIMIRAWAELSRVQNLTLTAIIIGAVANLSDRLIYGGVIDYLKIGYAGHYWPTFNLADAIIVGALIILIINYLTVTRRREINQK
jgi:signal peptidase II